MRTRLTLLLVCACFAAFAQKVDLDRYHFTVQYRNYPNNPLNKEYNTYNLVFGGSPTSRNFMMEDDLDRSINLHGWKKLNSNGHITVRVNFGDFIISSSTVNERKEETKDKDGKVAGYRYYYSARIVYNFPIRYSVNDYKNATLVNNESVSGGDKTWTSQEYSSYKEASDYYNNNRNVVRSNLSRTDMTQALASISSGLNFRYGFPPSNNYTKLWILNNKKHPENDAMQANWLKFKEISTRVTYEKVSEEDEKELKNIVAYFDGLKTKYTTSDKADKKLRYAAFFNNSMIYMWFLNDLDAAVKEADGLIANDYDLIDGKDLKRDADKLKEGLKKNNLTSMHYIINLDNAKAPN